MLQPLEDHRKSCATTNHYNLRPAGEHCVLQISIHLRMAFGDLPVLIAEMAHSDRRCHQSQNNTNKTLPYGQVRNASL